MLQALLIALGLLLAPVLLMNLLGPLVVWRSQTLPGRVRFEPIEPETFFAERDDEFRGHDQAMRALGFVFLGASHLTDDKTDTWFALYAHPGDQACAMVVSLVNPLKRATYVEFTQLYDDGSVLNVNDGPVPSPYPRWHRKLVARFSDVHAPGELHARFRRIRAGIANSSPPVTLAPDRAFEAVARHLAEESDHLVARGYCQPALGPDGRRALTPKGACLLTWRSIFPGKRLLEARDRREAASLLARADASA